MPHLNIISLLYSILIWFGSAGAARSGVFVVLDQLIEGVRKGSQELNVFNTVLELTTYRAGITMNIEEYKFIYDCLIEEISMMTK